jgi:hypothetical protein
MFSAHTPVCDALALAEVDGEDELLEEPPCQHFF